jgi:hypothetical protein
MAGAAGVPSVPARLDIRIASGRPQLCPVPRFCVVDGGHIARRRRASGGDLLGHWRAPDAGGEWDTGQGLGAQAAIARRLADALESVRLDARDLGVSAIVETVESRDATATLMGGRAPAARPPRGDQVPRAPHPRQQPWDDHPLGRTGAAATFAAAGLLALCLLALDALELA